MRPRRRLGTRRVGASLLLASALSLIAAGGAGAADGDDWEWALGRDVVSGGDKELERCTSAATCKRGLLGGAGEMDLPRGVATDAAGNVYVADQFNHRIQKFDSNGSFLRAWGKDVVAGAGTGTGFEICINALFCQKGERGTRGGEMWNPVGVAAAGGKVYVADRSNHRIQRFDTDGAFERAWGKDVDTAAGTGFEVCTVAASCKQGAGGGLGGEMNAPNGVAAAAGKVYLADTNNHRIQRFDTDGAFERTWGKGVAGGGAFETCTNPASCQSGASGGLGGEMGSPFGVAAAAGKVYVADTGNYRIQRFDADGGWERTWGKDVVAGLGTGTAFEVCTTVTMPANCKQGVPGALGGEMDFAGGVAPDGAGKVYVTGGVFSTSSNHRIQRFTTDGAWERAWGRDVVAGGGTGFEICTGAGLCKRGLIGGGGEMWAPNGVAVDAAGMVYIADAGNNRIQKFDSQGDLERAWGRDVVHTGPNDSGSDFEVCVAADGDICQAGISGSGGGETAFPTGIAVAGGKVYVADETNNRIQRFDTDGAFERTWGKDVAGGGVFQTCTNRASCRFGTPGALGGEMNGPSGVAAVGGKVYVADGNNHRIQRFDTDGNFERAWGKDVAGGGAFETCTNPASCQSGSAGGLGGEMNLPTRVAPDGGKVYVADTNNHRIQRFDTDGNFERAWGKDVAGGAAFETCTNPASCQSGAFGGLGGEMRSPHDVAVAGGKVYVADRLNDRIQRFDTDGNFERAWGKDVVSAGPGNVDSVFEVCVAADGDTCQAGSPGELGGEMNVPLGVAADGVGGVYVADALNDRIQRFGEPFSLSPAPSGGGGSGGGAAAGALIPSNAFEITRVKLKTNKGIGILVLNLPGPGEVGLEGPGLKEIGGAGIARKSLAVPGGQVKLKIKPAKRGKKARRLRKRLRTRGKAKVKPRVTYVPTGGSANTQTKKLKLVKK